MEEFALNEIRYPYSHWFSGGFLLRYEVQTPISPLYFCNLIGFRPKGLMYLLFDIQRNFNYYQAVHLDYRTISRHAEGPAGTRGRNKNNSHFSKGISMKRLFWLCMTMCVAIGICFAQDINGKWKTQMETQGGPMEMMFTFKTSGDTLTGAIEGPMGEMPISNGKKHGPAFSFDVSFNEWTISHDCIAMGDSILMKAPGMQGDTMNLVLKRFAESK
jgi:hypothetical protein